VRRLIVRKWCCALVTSTLLTSLVIGCGDAPKTETVPFKQTDASQFDAMKGMMIKNVQSKGKAVINTEKDKEAEKPAPEK
jgi:hypothetical protein